MLRCDLHMHTTFSDGTLTPEELVARAKSLGVATIALTDHDTLSGLTPCIAAGEQAGVRVIAGTELSVEYHGRDIHLLGYFPRPEAPRLEQKLTSIREARDNRNERICEKLRSLGLQVTLAEVEAVAGDKSKGASVGRPMIATVMMQKGYVTSVKEAFDLYLGERGKAFVDREKLVPEEAIQMIHEAGGVAVLAHPMYFGDSAAFGVALNDFVSWGLDGIECIYARHSAEHTEFYQRAAESKNLLITGGSDFHGAIKPDIELGTGLGNLFVPNTLADALLARLG